MHCRCIDIGVGIDTTLQSVRGLAALTMAFSRESSMVAFNVHSSSVSAATNNLSQFLLGS